MAKPYTTIQYNVADMVGDTSATFLTRIDGFLSNRYRDATMRLGATMWSYASLGELNVSSTINDIGDIIEIGAIADAWDAKRQFNKSSKYEKKYEYAIANRVISGDCNRFNTSFSRYDYYF